MGNLGTGWPLDKSGDSIALVTGALNSRLSVVVAEPTGEEMLFIDKL